MNSYHVVSLCISVMHSSDYHVVSLCISVMNSSELVGARDHSVDRPVPAVFDLLSRFSRASILRDRLVAS